LFSRSRTTSQIQGARAGGLDLKDLLLLPSTDNAGKESKQQIHLFPPFTLRLSLCAGSGDGETR
jgi:hypothetical protein